jgi:FAD:protein FMN transferase
MSVVADVLPGVRRVEQIMGMPIVVDVRDDDVDEAALDHVFAWFRWVDATFSTYKEDSEISRFAAGNLFLRTRAARCAGSWLAARS